MEAKKISELIEGTGVTRQKVAESLGVSVAMLRKYEHGYAPMPDARRAMLEKLAGVAVPDAAGSLGSGKSAAAVLAEVPATALIEELARRARAGRISEPGAGGSRKPRQLRAVAFTDAPED